jgi:16S rRNA C967 or C1407 C5-methylase (RsmB/RsmF family)
MGRGNGKRRGNNSRRKGPNNRSDNGGNGNNPHRNNDNRNNSNSAYATFSVDQGNYKMEAYYAAQGLHDYRQNEEGKLVPCETVEEKEAERQKWRTTISKILPSSFRIGKDVPVALREQMEAELKECCKTATGEYGDVVRQLKFLPHAYQLSLDRATIRKTPELEKLKNWLKAQTESGFISRQETVSMIPPVVLAPNPSDLVLDMCAAPGSKTGQLLEELNLEGCLVANDASASRAFMLVHQLRRIMDVNPSVLITCGDAQFFPSVLQFDRILADVPCSGDGTSRKNIGIWKNWAQTGALGLHKLQFDIAWKGVSNLLKIGGYLCYSTCSHNPLENEAVVAELLRKANGSLELVDTPLDGFRTRPGWSSWKVFFDDKSTKEVRASQKRTNNVFINNKPREDKVEDETMDESKKDDVEVKQSTDAETKESTETASEAAAPVVEETKDSSETASEVGVPAAAAPAVEETKESTETAVQDDEIAKTFRKFEPKSWDDAYLMEMALSGGMLHFDNMDQIPLNMKGRFRQSCFPPTKEEAERMHLERCIRCLAHDNDTGGFFVALLKKVGPIGSKETKKVAREGEDEGPEPKRAKLEEDAEIDQAMADVPADDNRKAASAEVEDKPESAEVEDKVEVEAEVEEKVGGRGKLNLMRDKDGKRNPKQGKDDFVPVEDAVMQPMIEYYGLSSDFPKGQYMTRAGGDAKVIYYIAKPVKDLIDLGLQDRVTVINSGLKGFIRNNKDCDCRYRIAQEGVHFLVPFIKKRNFVICRDDFNRCMTSEPTPIDSFSEAFRESVRPISVGSFVIVLEGFEEDCSRKMMLTMWRCRGDNVNGLVAKLDLESMKLKLSAIDGKPVETGAVETEDKVKDETMDESKEDGDEAK